MNKTLAGNFQFVIESFRITRSGGCKLTISVPENFAPKAAALALLPDTLYEADVFELENEVYGKESA